MTASNSAVDEPAEIRMDRRPLGPFDVSPIGFGAIRLTGPNVFGLPKDRGEALIVLREAVHPGVDHIDSAQYYGPNVANELIREVLHPYLAELILVSKVGAQRAREGGVLTDNEPRPGHILPAAFARKPGGVKGSP